MAGGDNVVDSGGGGPSPSNPNAAAVEAEKKYGRIRTLYKKKVSLAKTILTDTDAAVQTLQDAREDVRSMIAVLETCSMECRVENCTDLDPFQTEASVVMGKLDKQIQEQKSLLARDSKFRLQEVKTPRFSGAVGDYPRFKATFQELVGKRASDQIALIKLREEAFRTNSTEQLLIEGVQTLTKAFAILDAQFAHPETLRNALIVKLRDIPPITRLTDSVSLRRLAALVRSTMTTLEQLGKTENLDLAVFSALMTKLPPRVRQQIDDQILDMGQTPGSEASTRERFDILLARCDRQALVTETHAYRTRAYAIADSPAPGSGPKPDVGGQHIGSKFQKNPSGTFLVGTPGTLRATCLFHPDAKKHQTPFCNKLLVLPTHEILDTLRANDHCFRCFRKHGVETNCKVMCSEPGCAQPNTHGKLLHAAFHVDMGFNSGTNIQGVDQPNTQESQHDGEIGVEDAHLNQEQQQDLDYDSEGSNTACISSVDTLRVSGPLPSGTELDVHACVGKNSLRPCQTAYVINSQQQLVRVNVLYDLGSDLSQVTVSCVRKTALNRFATIPRLDLLVAGSSTPKAFGASELYTLPLYDERGSFLFKLDCVAIPFIGKLRHARVAEVVDGFKQAGHDCSDLNTPPAGEIDVLVGANTPGVHPVPVATIDTVTLAQSLSGKLVYGSHPSFPPSVGVTQSHTLASGHLQSWAIMSKACGGDFPTDPMVASSLIRVPKDRDLYDQIAEVDELPCRNCGLSRNSSREEVRKLEIYRDCLKFLPEENKVVAHLPWTVDLSNIPSNKPVAIKRLNSVTKALGKNPELRDAYRAEFQSMIDKGIICEVTDKEELEWQKAGGASWYVPHFPVVNENSSSTPVRVVFDSSVPYKGVKLSKLWELPPNLIPEMHAMYIRFRDFPYAICLDFRKAYWTVHLHERESHMQRLLWNDLDSAGNVKSYRMLRNSFGMVPSGALCSLAMLLVAEHYREEYPTVYQFVSEQVYVDDGVSSCNSAEEVIALARDISTVMAKGGFEIKHFLVAGQQLSENDVSHFQTALPDCAILAETPNRVLGALWNPVQDTISLESKVGFAPDRVRTKKIPNPTKLTMRSYLSAMASLFDPLGLASPVSILLKHELGRLFLLGLKWDEPIPHGPVQSETPTFEKCLRLLTILSEVTLVPFTRCLQPSGYIGSPTLVGFCDSSQSAYAACVYLNWGCGAARCSVLVMAKAKPFPKKGTILTIPRGELQACLLLARLVHTVQKSSRHTIDRTILLSDSTIALGQIASQPIRLKLWPAVRVDEIHDLTSLESWYHIASGLNIADIATRGCSPEQLGLTSAWQCGPSFLSLPISDWPIRLLVR